MRADDFEFDGRLLSSLGYIIVQFDESGGFNTSSAGSELTLTTVSKYGGRIQSLTSATYDNVFVGTISIAKSDGGVFNVTEYSHIMYWLNKKTYGKLRVIANGMEDIYFYGTFNTIEKVEHLGRIVGFTLTFTTNAPFGWGEQVTDSFSLTSNTTHVIPNTSEEDGELPFDEFVITCRGAGELKLTNELVGQTTIIAGCVSGEVITINGSILTVQSSTGRNVYDSFNFVYPRLLNEISLDSLIDPSYTQLIVTKSGEEVITKSGDNLVVYGPVNGFVSSLPCDIVAKYTPVRKVVF